MRTKLSLNVDDLSVDSFETTTAQTPGGTVFGEQCTCYTQCTCPGIATCDHTACGQASCAGTCAGATCEGTCAGRTCDEGTSCVWYQCGSAGASHCTPYECW